MGQMNSITYVGLDVHKTTIAVAVAEGGCSGEVRQLGIYANRADVLRRMVERLARGRSKLSFCYEAGPCGYGLHHFLRGLGHTCSVVASGRRTFITRAARLVQEAGGSLRDVQLLAGHRSIQTTQRYIDGDTDAQRKLVSMI
jgi:integrase